MNMKKAVAFLLSISMLAASFTACGGQTTSSVASAPTPESSSAVASSSSVAASEPVKEGPFFPLKEKIKVSMAGVRDDAGVPFEDCEAFKKLETETNVDIEWLDWPQSTQKEKRNLTFAGGTLPDAFYGSWTLDKPDVVKYGSEGMLLTFDDYLNEKYMPNFTKVLERQKDLRSAISTPDGHVYVLPSMNMEGLSKTNDTLLINTDWLKKVNKPMPTTIDELFDVLMAFKQAGDLNGNGKNDEIPMSFKYQDGNTGLFGFMGFTGLPMCNKNSRMVIKDGAPVFHSATPEYREFLTYMNKLNENGLLDQEVFTMDNAAYNAKTQAPVPTVGVMSAWSAENINRAIPGNKRTQDGVYMYVPPLKGKAGVEPKWSLRINAINANLSFCINAKTKYPEELVRWIDTFYAPTTSFHNTVGLEGVHLKSEGGNNWSRILKENGKKFSTEDMYPLIPAKFGTHWIFEGDFKFTDNVDSPQNKKAADAVYGPYQVKEYVNDYVMSTPEENEKMAFLTADLFAYVDQMSAKFITKGGIEQGWGEYMDQLKKLGVEDYVKIKNDIHTRASK